MANFLSTSLKNLFISLGASKTSDNNYAVPLLNATTKEPAGDMTISQLASVLGGSGYAADKGFLRLLSHREISNLDNAPSGTIAILPTNSGVTNTPFGGDYVQIVITLGWTLERVLQVGFASGHTIVKTRFKMGDTYGAWSS